MFTTPGSLLAQLQDPQEQRAWDRFVEIYTPFLYSWSRRVGVPRQDAIDLVQDVLLLLVEKLPEFRYDPNRSFRGWLRMVMLNKHRENLRRRHVAPLTASDSLLDDLASPSVGDAFEEQEYRRHIVGRAFQLMQSEFQPNTWKACWEHVVSGRPAADVARELNMSEGAVYVAKCRVLRRLRQDLEGLLD
jgi:RNA polymerase sigma-70 factor (ECF subfamily)